MAALRAKPSQFQNSGANQPLAAPKLTTVCVFPQWLLIFVQKKKRRMSQNWDIENNQSMKNK
jgi:hypothetical protein